jgi:hypothetical protein
VHVEQDARGCVEGERKGSDWKDIGTYPEDGLGCGILAGSAGAFVRRGRGALPLFDEEVKVTVLRVEPNSPGVAC